MGWEPKDPDFAARVEAGFAAQGFMALIGAELLRVAPGEVDIGLPLRRELSQQHGYAHAGAAWAIADSAAGFAAQSLRRAGDGVLTVELKINLLAPGRGERLIARGRIERPGRRSIVGRADVAAVADGRETAIATALGTFMVMEGIGSGA